MYAEPFALRENIAATTSRGANSAALEAPEHAAPRHHSQIKLGTRLAIVRQRMLTALTSGALFGLLNLGHCAGMCGPLAAAGCRRTGGSGPWRYQLGRTLAYGFAGGLCGHAGSGLQLYAPARWASLAFASLTAAACLFAARQLTRSDRQLALVQLGLNRSASRGWLRTLLRLLPREPLAVGAMSVLLPCGLLAAALLASVATGSGEAGAEFMTGFAATSGIAIVGAGWVMQRLSDFGVPVRRGLACLLVAGAVVIVARPFVVLDHHAEPGAATAPACH